MNDTTVPEDTGETFIADHNETQQPHITTEQPKARRAVLASMLGFSIAACNNSNSVLTSESSEEQPSPIDASDRNWLNGPVGTYVNIPAVIQAEDYVAHEGTRTVKDGSTVYVGTINDGDYTEYLIDVPTRGYYTIRVHVSSRYRTGTVNFIANGSTVGNITVPPTGDWNEYVPLHTVVPLVAGKQTLRLYYTGPYTGPLMNVNWLVIYKAADTNPNEVQYDDRPFNRASASRFLGQAAFGATDESIEAVLDKGYSGWIDDQILMPDDANTYDYVVSGDWLNNPVGNSLRFEGYSAAWMRMVTSPDELRQRMVAALCQIFVFNPKPIGENYTRYSGSAWVDLISKYAFGSYRELLEAVATSHQMGKYLTLINSRRENDAGALPDENFAREVMQLFSIGLVELNLDGTPKTDANADTIDTYDTDDIMGLARAFTGWESTQVDGDNANYWLEPMVQNATYHEPGEKTFLGTTIPAGKTGEQSLQLALDVIANHSNVGPFIVKLLIQRLVKSNPSPAYIERIATVFNDDGTGERGNLGAVLKALLLDPEARGIPDKLAEEQGKVREPMISFAQLARFANQTNAPVTRDYVGWGLIFWWQELFPQAPLASPSVFNFYPTTYSPPGTELSARGLAAPELYILDEPHVVIYANIMYSIISSYIYRNITHSDYDFLMDYASDPRGLVLKLDELLAGTSLTEETIETIVESVTSLSDATNGEKLVRIRAAIYLIMISPNYLVQH